MVRVHIPTQPDERALAAAGARDRTAEHNSLRPLLAPTSLVVIGVSRFQSGIGYEILHGVLAAEFTGRTYPVNPHAKTIDGLDCYPTVGDIPERVDLAVVAVPASSVPQIIEECGAAHVGAAVVLSAGFGETGPSGAATESRLLASARRHDIRVVGPNCIGLINTDPFVRLNATFAPNAPTPGHLAVATQSGAVGVAILDSAERSGVGISTFVSLGNKIDVGTNDLLSYWYDDLTTRAVALYVESFGNPRRFTWLARALSTRKPILAVKSGRSTAGRRAGTSHTAAAAAPDVAVDTLFRQAGVLRMDSLGELLDAARLLTEQPLPAGDRVAIVGNAGGLNVLAADATEAAGLHVVELSAALQQQFADLPHTSRGSPTPWIWALMHRRRRSAAPFALLALQVKSTRWWSRWSPLARMTCREHLLHCPKRATTSRTCRSLRLLSVAIRHSSFAAEMSLSMSCRKTRFAPWGTPAGMRAGAANPPAASR